MMVWVSTEPLPGRIVDRPSSERGLREKLAERVTDGVEGVNIAVSLGL